MSLIITVIHIMVSVALVFVVLLQKGSGADMGSAFGGSSQSVFGAQGSGSFLGKLTAGLATIFMITSLTLAFFTTQESAGISIMSEPVVEQSQPADDMPTPPSAPLAPTAPAAPAAPSIPAPVEMPSEGDDSIPSVPKAGG
ncbi:MAG: preprotein translocase subunit SecG [Magnetococcales bacterium]|nr:preprotein translocase subunit SecG [Magnetococcales bacterium]